MLICPQPPVGGRSRFATAAQVMVAFNPNFESLKVFLDFISFFKTCGVHAQLKPCARRFDVT